MPKYIWEAKPPITRNDIFNTDDCWETGTIYSKNDDEAILWLERTFKRHNIANYKLTMKITLDGKTIRTIKDKVNA